MDARTIHELADKRNCRDAGSGRAAQDRAAIFASTCWHISADSFLEWLRGGPIFPSEVISRIATLARDEFADIEREVLSEIRPAGE